MGHIDSDKANPVYVVGEYYKTPGWNYPNMMCVWHKDYDGKNCNCKPYHTITNKNKQTNKQTKEKKKILT